MRLRRSILLLSFACFLPTVAWAAAVPPKRVSETERVRTELSSYFRDIAGNSPTVLGGLSSSPETMDAIQQRIASMSDEDIARFGALLADAPDWKIAPEAFASALPGPLRRQALRVGEDLTTDLPKGAKMRDDVRTLVEVLKLVPDAKLAELGIDRKTIDSLETTFRELPALEATLLQRRAMDTTSWGERSAMAIAALPPALQRGATALSEHGPLTEADVADLESFRDELSGLLEKIEALPPEIRAQLDVEILSNQLDSLEIAPPDVLFMLRHNIPAEMLDGLRRNVAFLQRLSTFTEEEKNDLESFRSDLAQTFKKAGPQSDTAQLDAMLAELGPEHLLLLRERMDSYGAWQVAFPATYRTLAAPETRERMLAVSGPAPDPEAVRSLEVFREEGLRYIDGLEGAEGIDPQLLSRARATMESAPLDRLEIIRSTAVNLGVESSAAQRLAIVVMHEINWNCSLSMTAVPEVCVDACDIVGEDCEVCTPAVVVTASFDSFCNPIEDAIESVEHSIVGAANAVVETMRTAINQAITEVNTTVNAAITSVTTTINSTISDITSTVDGVWTFLQTVPDLAWDTIKTALNLLLDIEIRNGVTMRELLTDNAGTALTAMKDLLGLADGWWNAVSTFTLPAIPCPPAGFHTPFGDVGEDAAVHNYGRYKLVLDGIVNMIPDTETSLAVKVPAKLLYMSFDFLGLCLEQAAATADDQLAADRHDLVIANFASLESYIGTQVAGLSAQTGGQTDQLIALINTRSDALQGTIGTQSSAVQTQLSSESAAIQSLMVSESSIIQTLLASESDLALDSVGDFRDVNLKLTIERVLGGGVGAEIGSFQLRAPWGYLDLVSQVVRDSIDAMIASGEGIGQAEKFYQEGLRQMQAGNDKDAFTHFARAYRDAAK